MVGYQGNRFNLYVLVCSIIAFSVGCIGEPHRIGPYLQTVTQASATILWETEMAGDSRVDFGLTSDYGRHVYSSAEKTIHEITLEDLSPETRYHYRVSSAGVEGLDHTFQTAVEDATPFRFGVYGDTQENFIVHRLIADALLKEDPDIVLHVGDEVLRGNDYQSWLTEFFRPARDLMFRVPVYVAIGNHEEDAIWFYDYHAYPEPENYYSFRYGNSFFVVIDTNDDISQGSVQHAWIEQTLASPEAQGATWLFVAYHHPAYNEGWRPCTHDGEQSVRDFIVPLMEVYGVDIVFNGHTHGYERGFLDGVYYVVSGGGGGGLDRFCHDWPHVTVSEYIHHYVMVDIDGSILTLAAHHRDGTVFDSFSITK